MEEDTRFIDLQNYVKKYAIRPQEDIMDLGGDPTSGGPADSPEMAPPNGPAKHAHSNQKILCSPIEG